ncbi:TIGR03943 family protein [Streptomyces sp. NBC_01728]|uniref:TIGR03943 family putative permease subunit n=1 Tax=unclassified Streptomyces TaxID=2593676 RepID=UPI00224D4408|nr:MULTISPECIES: TIGR03943 family protein [unclassified Streptomyces]MCX4455565.1 TIGR03943 family protein [Streptomyces sp. NBC_01719]MCX4494925.1 TIGR03943 family protein [Streptomyces sp. NBC_01728]MCX4590510.1 TIGR03943 family protein [Streptomyces sp. NBC_01549]
MRRPFQVTLLVLSGLGLLHASLFTDLSLRFVKEGMRPMLVASGVLLLVLGVAEAWSNQQPDSGEAADSHGHGHGHDHSTVPRIAWLLFLPALSLLFYAPPALGAYTAAREAPKAVTEQRYFEPLPATSPVPLTLTQFTSRVQQDHKRDIRDRSIRMTGFVTPDKGGDGWYLTRIIFTCCAADAQSVKVRIHGAAALPADTWVAVTGTWHPGGTLGTSSAPAALDARTVKKVAKPVNAYTDALPLF